MKRLISLLLVVIMVFAVFPLATSAEEPDREEVYNIIAEALSVSAQDVDVSSYRLPIEEIGEIYTSVINNEPMLFYVAYYFSYSMDVNTVKKIYPVYNYSGEELETAREFVEAETDAIIALIPEGLDDYEKALFLHDYICVNFEYNLSESIGNVYDMLKEGTAVCQGYTLLYDLLLGKVGIDSYAVVADEINHVWNQVKLGENWYHVDVTWDDPVNDFFARAMHKNFIMSDDKAKENHEIDWFDAVYECSDTSFDDYLWHNSPTSFAIANGELYKMNGLDLYKFDLVSGEEVFICTLEGSWYFDEIHYYIDFVHLGGYEDYIIYNTDKAIFALDLVTLESYELHRAETTKYNNIYAFYTVGDTAYYAVADNYMLENATYHSFVLDLSFINPEPEIMLGDVNGNREIDANDYALAKRAYLSTYDLSEEQFKASDVNRNGILDIYDYLAIKRAYLGTYNIQQ